MACSTNGLGAKHWYVGYSYAFSKRTDVFAVYAQVENERSAQYGLLPNVGTTSGNGITAPGADTVAVGLGIIHTF